MHTTAALLLVLSLLAFLVAIVLYGLLLLRLRSPVSFFELRTLVGTHAALGQWTWRAWAASVTLAVLFGAAMLAGD